MSPMLYPLWILLLAIVLFVLEVFIPSGGILGALSTICFVAAITAAFAYGGLKMGTAFMAATSVLIPVLIYLLIKLWPKTPIGKLILIGRPDSSKLLPEKRRRRQELIGERGVAVTALLPAGAIRIQGRTIDAISDGVTIEKGTPIEVIAVRNNAIVVRQATTPAQEGPVASDDQGAMNAVIPDPFDEPLP